MSCWRTTDNRHYDSPARMSDGRLFTDYRSPAVQNRLLASQLGFPSVGTDPYRSILQSSGNVLLEQDKRLWEIKATSSDQWKHAYAPPPPQYGIFPDSRDGVDIRAYTTGIGARVFNTPQPLKHTPPVPQIQSVPPSICGPTSLNSPMWAIHPQTLVFQIRPAAPAGDIMFSPSMERH